MAYAPLNTNAEPDHPLVRSMIPPRNAHPVAAPFKRTTVNDSIEGSYIVQIATVNPAPDVLLHSANGRIDTTLYFLGGLPRRIGVVVESINGQIKLALPEQQHAQNLDVRTHSVNGATHLALPPTFKGYLRLTSTNGSLQLGDSLQANSKLLSGDNQKDLLYFITPSSSSFGLEDESVEKMDFAQVDDSCHCSSVSGRIEVDYYGSMDGEEDIDKEDFAWSRVAERQCCIIT